MESVIVPCLIDTRRDLQLQCRSRLRVPVWLPRNFALRLPEKAYPTRTAYRSLQRPGHGVSASWAWRICISPSDVGQDDSLHANAKLVRFSSRQLDDTIIGLRSRLCRADVVSGRILSLYDKAIDLNT